MPNRNCDCSPEDIEACGGCTCRPYLLDPAKPWWSDFVTVLWSLSIVPLIVAGWFVCVGGIGVLLFASVFFMAWAALTVEAGVTWVARAIGM
jgi:hypothetical protein